jgi:hypothetical protein
VDPYGFRDLDPAFHLNADPDLGSKLMIIHADSDHKKLNFYMKIGIRKYTYEGTKDFLKVRKPGLFVRFGKFPCFGIRIRITNTANTVRIRIQDSKINADHDSQTSVQVLFKK